MLNQMVVLLFIVLLFGHINAAFVHPGVLINKDQLDFVKQQVSNKVEPIYGAYQKAVASPYGSKTYKVRGPPEGGIIDCGSFSHPDIGCSDATNDAATALTQALLWYISEDATYSKNAINIMNTYAEKLKGYNNSNAPLQAGWDAEKWPATAEIIRYSNAGWPAADITRFGTMLSKVIQPLIDKGSGANGNWELTMIDACLGIAVFNEDQALFNTGVTFWKQRLPAYFYISTDGPKPVPPPRGNPSWYGQTVFNASVDGICQETCRDFGHTQMGLAAATHAAETARIQGLQLYELEETRITAAMEFHTKYLLGAKIPDYVCGGDPHLADAPTYEVAYNEYHNRLGKALPNTIAWIEKYVRAITDPVNPLMMIFETLIDGAAAPKI